MIKYTATYSPDDNKIRLYASARLDAETYARVKAAGFGWAPRQELFVAPKWTPERSDLAIELAGELEDEDKSLVDRAEERAERFEEYSDKRETEAHRAHEYVASIADGIPLGQPILVGHHSERHARKDAQRIENGMRKAVKLWETSKYWEHRAKGALSHAKYKERPEVRARRIKAIEAEERKYQRNVEKFSKFLAGWTADGLTLKRALLLSNYGVCPSDTWGDLDKGTITPEQARDKVVPYLRSGIERCSRWLDHLKMRLIYERCMLEESGYVAPVKVKSLKETLPLCNYRAETITFPNQYYADKMITVSQREMTKAEYSKIHNDYKGTRIVDRSHKVRIAIIRGDWFSVFLTDSKVHEKPAPAAAPEPKLPQPRATRTYVAPERTPFDEMKDSLKAGVRVVSTPQLFPTPSTVAADMVALAEIEPGHRVLEPSAGTGVLVSAINDAHDDVEITAVEINSDLVTRLRLKFNGVAKTVQNDFLELLAADLGGKFDRVVMNPPFAPNAADVAHILHAIELTKPGGRVVAICANGPRQQKELRHRAESWEDLPEGTFASQGTNVLTVLATFVVT
jgi:phospholipid N-methyltransferase